MDNLQHTIPSWPSLSLPKLSQELPPLSLETSLGRRELGSESLDQNQTFTMYVCGITPYDATHLGHAATYLAYDLIHRYQQLRGFRVRFVENITDIDEPLLERATRDKIDWTELAADQIDLFRADMTALHILPPHDYVPATRVMDLVDTAISQMAKNGFVYQVENDLYFDSSPFHADLPISVEEALEVFAERGGDPERKGKRHPLDPVLWWANKNDEPGWESSHGFGRPGWHIECSVIALRFLIGSDYLDAPLSDFSISLQGGGSDLIFPHHFMSGAQGKAILGKPFARHYVHSGMVGLDGEKMSKSRGNLVFVSKLLSEGTDPLVIRYALLKSHFQSDRMWSEAMLREANEAVTLIREALSKEQVTDSDAVIQKIIESLANNLDTPMALRALEDWAKDPVRQGESASSGALSRVLDSLLGLAF